MSTWNMEHYNCRHVDSLIFSYNSCWCVCECVYACVWTCHWTFLSIMIFEPSLELSREGSQITIERTSHFKIITVASELWLLSPSTAVTIGRVLMSTNDYGFERLFKKKFNYHWLHVHTHSLTLTYTLTHKHTQTHTHTHTHTHTDIHTYRDRYIQTHVKTDTDNSRTWIKWNMYTVHSELK